jgi:NADH dehydrogenase (ubiquinone) 1 alpha/beta subcomplex 1
MSWRLQEQKRFYAGGAHKLTEAEVTERVLNVVKGFDKVDPNKVSAAAHFANDLGLDSLDAVEVVMALEEEFCIEIPDAEAEKIVSTKDAITYIVTHPQAK